MFFQNKYQFIAILFCTQSQNYHDYNKFLICVRDKHRGNLRFINSYTNKWIFKFWRNKHLKYRNQPLDLTVKLLEQHELV